MQSGRKMGGESLTPASGLTRNCCYFLVCSEKKNAALTSVPVNLKMTELYLILLLNVPSVQTYLSHRLNGDLILPCVGNMILSVAFIDEYLGWVLLVAINTLAHWYLFLNRAIGLIP